MTNLNPKVLSIALILSILSTGLYASSINPILPNSASLKWFDASNLPPGAKLIILAGNPKKKEFYVARLKLPAHFVVPPHSHLSDEYNTIISGTYFLGIGNTINKANMRRLPAGSFIKFPATAVHYGFTKEETIIEISGIGPWGTVPKKLRNKQS